MRFARHKSDAHLSLRVVSRVCARRERIGFVMQNLRRLAMVMHEKAQ